MSDPNRTETSERRPRGRRSKDPEELARQSAEPQPQQSADALQKDPSPSATPDDGTRFERVRQRAYELYVKRGARGGDEVLDWLEAERQIDAERP